jgi:hypothetical protein
LIPARLCSGDVLIADREDNFIFNNDVLIADREDTAATFRNRMSTAIGKASVKKMDGMPFAIYKLTPLSVCVCATILSIFRNSRPATFGDARPHRLASQE